MNKEDIWVTRIPVPVRQHVTGPVHDTFDSLEAGGPVTDWNTYSPRWAPVGVADFPSAANKSLELQDKDPYDYARAVRVFPETKSATLHFKIHVGQNHAGRLEIELTDRFGYRPVPLVFAEDGQIHTLDGAKAHDRGAPMNRASGTTWASRSTWRTAASTYRLTASRSLPRLCSRNTPKASSGFPSAREPAAISRLSRPRPIARAIGSIQTRTYLNRWRSITLTM